MTGAAYAVGTQVTVSSRAAAGHCRTPCYSRGVQGTIVAFQGHHRDPENLAYHGEGLPLLPLYQVKIRQANLWPDYRGQPCDFVLIDVYEHWLQQGGDGA